MTNKTQPTTASIAAWLETVPENRKADTIDLLARMERLSGHPPVLWGAIVGFGSYHYRYDTGREGDFMRIGFAPRKAKLTLYLLPGYDDHGPLLARLGKHSIGKSCLYVNKLADLDLDVLDELITKSLDDMEKRYPST